MIVTSCTPDVLLKLMRVFSPLETQRSYNARKSAVDDITTGGEGFRQVPLRTTSAQCSSYYLHIASEDSP
jgi:hypothetical protein